MSSKNQESSLTQYRCPTCNAPYPLGADDVISTCPYCGFTFVVESGEEKLHFIVPLKLNETQIIEAVSKWIEFAASKSVGKGFTKNIEIGKPLLQWIPVFRVKADFETYHFGASKKGSGDKQYWVKEEGRDSGVENVWVIARRHAATFGINELIDSLGDLEGRKFDIDLTENAPVLNSEIEEGDAQPRARHSKSERDRSELNEKMDKLFDYRIEMTMEDCSYTHVPYWLLRYEHEGGTFRVAVSGATGEVVLGELPVTKRYRIKKWFTSVLMLITSAILFQALPYLLWVLAQADSSSGDVWIVPIAMVLIAGVLWIGSYQVIGGVLKYEVEVTTEGEERDKGFSLESVIKDLARRG